MDDDKYSLAFQLILNAGNSKSASKMAIESAKKFEFEQAEKYLEEAERELKIAHKSQVDMIQREAQGHMIEVNIVLVHAQDHLTMAMIEKDHAKEILDIYKIIKPILHR
ncbi:PTS lactose/cellobiose transporter subunit IIA [Clostridium sp. Marseille-Q2269]|uniref:PTS lactose/cellobiose transporter subunit IIA n=1 Tax=Clostridium sp. Marseille-Q2269 TaxID=2942205 RepID=UPI002072E04D|nr:PTS lactose/cellobiose transporter subunit IIA [Clostridium sp. Marseille-Q2269]